MIFNIVTCVPRILRFNDLVKISNIKKKEKKKEKKRFLVLCSAISPRTNFDEIILPHIFASFRAVVYGSVFRVLWIYSNAEEILSSKIVRLKFRLIHSQLIF